MHCATAQWNKILQGKNVEDFDHVKHDRMLEAEDLGQERDESSVKKENMSEDMQRMMQKLNSSDAAKVNNALPIPDILRIMHSCDLSVCQNWAV